MEKFLSFAECVAVSGGYVIRHRESLYEYFPPQPSELAAWEKFKHLAVALGQGVGAMLEIAPIVTIRLEHGTIKKVGRPAKPRY